MILGTTTDRLRLFVDFECDLFCNGMWIDDSYRRGDEWGSNEIE